MSSIAVIDRAGYVPSASRGIAIVDPDRTSILGRIRAPAGVIAGCEDALWLAAPAQDAVWRIDPTGRG